MDNEIELKRQFAEALIKNDDDAFRAALSLFPQVGKALQVANAWKNDDVVKQFRADALNSVDAALLLPSKEKQAFDIYAIATNTSIAPEDRLKAHRLYAEVRGFIEKPQAGGNLNVLNQGVMLVRDHGSDDDWEAKATEQQRKLISNATSVN